MASRVQTTDYRFIDGLMVTAVVLRLELGASLYRETLNADLGVPPGTFFCTAITFYLTFRAIADEGATNAATVGYLLPVVSVRLRATTSTVSAVLSRP
jgi:hypothetical protein